MTTQATYRSVVRNLITALEKEHGDKLTGWGIDAELGPLADVYRQAKSLTTDEQTPTMFVSISEDGAYDASIANHGLSDIAVVVVDETNHDTDGTLISITHDEGRVFSARVKMLVPTETHFDTAKVMDFAMRDPYSNGMRVLSGMERAIGTFSRWMIDIRPDHFKLLKTAKEAMDEHGADAYSDYLDEAIVNFRAGMLTRATQLDPSSNETASGRQLDTWLESAYSPENTEFAIAAAVYEQGINKVMENFENEPVQAPSI